MAIGTIDRAAAPVDDSAGRETRAPAPPPVTDEDRLRAELYDLLAALLRGAPDGTMLDALSHLEGDDDTGIGRAAGALARIAATFDAPRAAREYHDLFIGVGRGELVPYGSYYLTGFLNEKPLGDLRGAMRELGLRRAEGGREPEDHAASLLEMMAGLIDGRFGAPAATGEQAAFFERHLGSWMPYFFRDLEGAGGAVLYAPVGTIGRTLMEVEAQAFAMA